MKKILKLLTLWLCVIASLFSMAGCEGKNKIKKGYKEVLSYITEALYDPESLQVYSAEGVYCDDSEDIYYKVKYNAKNKFGGYVGAEDYYYTYDTTTGKVSKSLVTTTFSVQKGLYQAQEEGADFDEKYYYLEIV